LEPLPVQQPDLKAKRAGPVWPLRASIRRFRNLEPNSYFDSLIFAFSSNQAIDRSSLMR